MANKNQEPISRWDFAKAIAIVATVVILLAITIDGCDEPGKAVSPYSRVVVWLYVIAVLYVLTKAKFKKGWFD
jgi:hypothetical protein